MSDMYFNDIVVYVMLVADKCFGQSEIIGDYTQKVNIVDETEEAKNYLSYTTINRLTPTCNKTRLK